MDNYRPKPGDIVRVRCILGGWKTWLRKVIEVDGDSVRLACFTDGKEWRADGWSNQEEIELVRDASIACQRCGSAMNVDIDGQYCPRCDPRSEPVKGK